MNIHTHTITANLLLIPSQQKSFFHFLHTFPFQLSALQGTDHGKNWKTGYAYYGLLLARTRVNLTYLLPKLKALVFFRVSQLTSVAS